MDISYSVNKNWGLLKSYRDKNDAPRSGFRLWGLRTAQVLIDLMVLGLVAVFVVMIITGSKSPTIGSKSNSTAMSSTTEATQGQARALPNFDVNKVMGINEKSNKKVPKKPPSITADLSVTQGRFTKHKAMVWAAISLLELILSSSGVVLYLLAKKASKSSSWEIMSGIYHWANAHIILYALVLGSADVLSEDAMDKGFHTDTVVLVSCLAGGCGFIAFLVHFSLAFFPTPFPLLLREQKAGGGGEKTKDETFVDARLSQSGTIDNPNNSGETLETPASAPTAAGTTPSSDQVPSATPSKT